MLWNITLWPQKADCLFKRTLVKAAKSEPGLCTQSVLHHRNPCQPGSPVVVERERERVRVRVRVHVCVSMWEGLNRGEADGCINSEKEKELTGKADREREEKYTKRRLNLKGYFIQSRPSSTLGIVCVVLGNLCVAAVTHLHTHTNRWVDFSSMWQPVSEFNCKTVKWSRTATHLFMQLFCLAGLC